MTSVPREMENESAESAYVDVWSRTSSKHRARAVLLLVVNVVLFAALACFAFWIRQGEYIAPRVDGYWRLLISTMGYKGDATLANFVLFPIRVDQVPMHGVVVGLMLAALVSVPILISILYRFFACIPFILAVAFLAVMPWLAITLTGACILASVRPFRFRFRYASALLGLVLVLLYFYGASRQTPAPVDQYAPQDRLKFMGPWVLATIGSCLMMGGVLLLARVVDYRPGVVAPSLLVFFIVPMILFAQHVGPDELYYRLLERRMRQRFAPMDLSQWFEQLVHRSWVARPSPRPELQTVRQSVELQLSLAMDPELDPRNILLADFADLIEECDWFLYAFPQSRYAVNVLYLRGRAMDARIDQTAFDQRRELRLYDDFPADRSETTWKMVVYNAPRSSMAAVARYKLALLAARHRRMDDARSLLRELIALYGSKDTASTDSEPSGVLVSKPPDVSLEVPVDRVVADAHRLIALLENNLDDPRYAERPFCGSRPGEPRKFGYLQLDPRHTMYRRQLLRIISADGYPGCLLADNIALQAALEIDDAQERASALQRCMQRYPEGDAYSEILFRLGVAYDELGEPTRARETLERLVRDYPDDTWVQPARDRLRSITPVAAESTG